MQFPQNGDCFFFISKYKTMKDKSSNFRLSSTAKERLKALALETNKDMTKVLELAIMQYNPHQAEQNIIVDYTFINKVVESIVNTHNAISKNNFKYGGI